MPLESVIQSKIMKSLEKKGWIVVRNSVCNLSGWPDLTAYKKKRTVFIEVKKEGEKPTELQLHRHNQLVTHGFEVFVMTSAGQVKDNF